MKCKPANGHYFRRLLYMVSFVLWSGCSLQPLQQQSIGDLKYITYRPLATRANGVVVGDPHGIAEITVLDFGKIESISGKQKSGIVIGAPHGTFDFYTAGTVREICSRTGLAGVIATGFTPTESGDGWRINVNRPSERYVTLSEREIETARARTTYEHFKNSVLNAARGNLLLYIDIHQNSGQSIEVASVGFSKTEARLIKNIYRALRDRARAEHPDVTSVDLAIEPLDPIEVGAWAAKTNGILSVANKSLHFELPSDGVMASSRQRAIYTSILTELIRKIAARVSSVN